MQTYLDLVTPRLRDLAERRVLEGLLKVTVELHKQKKKSHTVSIAHQMVVVRWIE